MDFRNIIECEPGTPGWKHPDVRIRIDTVQFLDEQDLLIKIAQTDSSPSVRAEAAFRIEDQDFLKYLYYNEKDSMVRRSIVNAIDDESLLINIAYGNDDVMVRCAAVSSQYLKDETVLEEIAKNDTEKKVRLYCVMNPNLTN